MHKKIDAHVGEVENFERMVWRSAKEFGIGRAKSRHLPCTYYIGWYNPIQGTASDNVFKGRFDREECVNTRGTKPKKEKYLRDKSRGIFLCGGRAQTLREKMCEHFGC
jgi:hypothetical protein